MRAESPRLDRPTRLWVLAATGACLLPLLLQLPPTIAVGIALAALSTGALSWRGPIPLAVRLVLVATVVGATLSATGVRIGRAMIVVLVVIPGIIAQMGAGYGQQPHLRHI